MAQQIRLGHEVTLAHKKAMYHERALKAWDTRGRKGTAAYRRKRGIVQSGDDYGRDKFGKAEKTLRESDVDYADALGGGISETYQVRLKGNEGPLGNFKPDSGEMMSKVRDGIEPGKQAEREVAAWEVAKIVGLDDMVGPVVTREVDVPGMMTQGRFGEAVHHESGLKRGSLATWAEGTIGANIGPAARKYDGKADLLRAAMFDYIIGNQDRHGRNWVIGDGDAGDDDGKLKLIDHGLAFGDNEVSVKGGSRSWTSNSMLMRRAVDWHPDSDPGRQAATYVLNKAKIMTTLRKAGIPEAGVQQVARRIDFAQRADGWAEIYDYGG